MAFTTSSGFPDLVGSCEISGTDCTSYTSNNLGAGTVRNLGGPNLMFQVDFPGPGNVYTITANASGSGYSGEATSGGELDPRDIDEPWAATATGEPAAAAKATK